MKNLSKKFNEVYAVKNINFTIGTNKTMFYLVLMVVAKKNYIDRNDKKGLIKPTRDDYYKDKNIILKQKTDTTFVFEF